MNPDWLVTSLREALPQQLRSIILFGSAAAGDFVERSSKYDLLVVCDPLGMPELNLLAPAIRRWRTADQPLPLLFTSAQLAASVDAFALEFAEMQHARRILFGDDLMAALKIDPAHVRIQLERELKGKSLALRDRYALAAGKRRRILALLVESHSAFLSLFRAALRLYQESAPNQKLDALQALAQQIGFDPQSFVVVAELKAGTRSPRAVDVHQLFKHYWQAIEAVTAAVDLIIHSEPRGD